MKPPFRHPDIIARELEAVQGRLFRRMMEYCFGMSNDVGDATLEAREQELIRELAFANEWTDKTDANT